jgi:hypothetical protein
VGLFPDIVCHVDSLAIDAIDDSLQCQEETFMTDKPVYLSGPQSNYRYMSDMMTVLEGKNVSEILCFKGSSLTIPADE